jgi:hypothetical protein
MMCGILYVFVSCVILLIRKALKDFMKMFGHSLIHSNLFTLTSLPIKPDNLLSSEKPFSTPGDKINFCFWGSALVVQLFTVVTVRWENDTILSVILRTALSGLKPLVFWNILVKCSSFVSLHKRGFLIRT